MPIPSRKSHADLVASFQGRTLDSQCIELDLTIGLRVPSTPTWVGNIPRVVPHIAPCSEDRHTSLSPFRSCLTELH